MTIHHRKIHSFVRRQGRFTACQRRAVDTLWHRYGLTFVNKPIDLDQAFMRESPCTVEIGVGDGANVLHQAALMPERNFVAIDVHQPGIGRLLHAIHAAQLENVRVVMMDAVVFLREAVVDHALDTLQIFFPDPWHKRRHHKRRLVQPDFISLAHTKLKPHGGVLHIATDWVPYAEQMLADLTASEFVNVAGHHGYFNQAYGTRCFTKYEERGVRLGHDVRDIVFQTK